MRKLEVENVLAAIRVYGIYPVTVENAIMEVKSLRDEIDALRGRVSTARDCLTAISNIPPHYPDSEALGLAIYISREWLRNNPTGEQE